MGSVLAVVGRRGETNTPSAKSLPAGCVTREACQIDVETASGNLGANAATSSSSTPLEAGDP
jgi:hypothetical protein